MADVVSWLRAELDDDEQVAKHASYGDRGAMPKDDSAGKLDDPSGGPSSRFYRVGADSARDFLLGLIEARRRVVAVHGGEHDCPRSHSEAVPGKVDELGEDLEAVHYREGELCPALRKLASSYAHRRGYQDKWGPRS